MDRCKAETGRVREKRRAEERRSEKRKSQKKEAQMREKVGKSRNTVFFQWCVAPEGRKVGSLKRRVRSHLARWEMKKCTPLWREAHFEVKMYKTHQLRTTFGSWDVEKVHAVVARSTFRSQNVQNTSVSDHFWKLRCRKSVCRCGAKHISKSKCTKHFSVGPLLEVEMSKKCTLLRREAHFEVKMYKTHQFRTIFGRSDVVSCSRGKGLRTFSKVSKTWGFCSTARVGHLKRICKDAFSGAGAVQETLSSELLGGPGADFLREVSVWSIRSSGLPRWFCVTGAFLWPGITFSWQAQYFRQVDWKKRKTHWHEAVSTALNFPFFPKQFTVRGSHVCALSPSFAWMSPLMCLPEWWCPPLRSCLCLVSLHVSPWVVVSASPVLSVPCLPSFVSLSGGVRLSNLVCALSPLDCLPSCVSLSDGVRLPLRSCLCLVSLHLSPFACLPEWWCPPLRSCLCLVSLNLSPFMCLPEWWCPPLRSCLCLVSLHVSPWVVVSASPVLSVPCLPSFVSLSGGVRLSNLVCALSPLDCLPSCVSLSDGVRLPLRSCLCLVSLHLSPFACLPEWWCPPLRSCLCLVSLNLSPFMCLPEWWCPPLRSCLCLVSLHLSPFMCLPEWWCPTLRSCLCLVSLHSSPFMCLSEWWCPPRRSCLCLDTLHVSPWVVVSASPVLSPFICLPSCVSLSGGVRLAGLVCALSPFICLPSCVSLGGGVRLSGLVCALSPFICLPSLSPWVVVSASPVLSVPCLPSCVSLSGGVRLSGLVCALSPFIRLPSCVSLSGGVRLSGLVCALSPFMCLPEWWCPPLRSCLCLVSLHCRTAMPWPGGPGRI